MRRVRHAIIAWTVAWGAMTIASCNQTGQPGATDVSPPPAPNAILYRTDFEGAEVGAVPADLFVVDGQFAVKAIDGNKVLELAGQPLRDFAVLFGPRACEGVEASASVRGEASGRRMPSFGVGLGGVRGYKVMVTPAKRQVELVYGRETVAAGPYKWASGDWTRVRLRITAPAAGQWLIQAKAWPRATPEPDGWNVAYTANTQPSTGRAAAWGTPYSGKPIQYDDLEVRAAPTGG
jgi:hypothetical protein